MEGSGDGRAGVGESGGKMETTVLEPQYKKVKNKKEHSFFPYCPVGVDYHEDTFRVCIDINILSLG